MVRRGKQPRDHREDKPDAPTRSQRRLEGDVHTERREERGGRGTQERTGDRTDQTEQNEREDTARHPGAQTRKV